MFEHGFMFYVLRGSEEESLILEETQVTQEMLEEQLVRIVTRELLDLISKWLKLYNVNNGTKTLPEAHWYHTYGFCPFFAPQLFRVYQEKSLSP